MNRFVYCFDEGESRVVIVYNERSFPFLDCGISVSMASVDGLSHIIAPLFLECATEYALYWKLSHYLGTISVFTAGISAGGLHLFPPLAEEKEVGSSNLPRGLYC